MIPYEFDAERFSRWMAYVLRHNPARYGLQPDRHGYVDFDEFFLIAKRRYPHATPEMLKDIISTGGAGRFEMAGERLRARYGHSIPVEPPGEAVEPPPILYAGLEAERVQPVLKEGLMPRDRQLVHLSESLADALSLITKKTDQSAVLRIDAAGARGAGILFYREGKVYLTARIPAPFLTLEPASSLGRPTAS